VYEVLAMDDELRYLIAGSAPIIEVTRKVRENGSAPLIEDGIAKVAEGFTTVEDLLRVLGPQ
jgi:type II secretory ATPase GspE/PulE/Tfp pilus assembly ATPase PilB-like protein